MQQTQTIEKLSAALADAQAEFKGIYKGGFNKFDKYSYAKLEDYVRATQPILSKFGLTILTSVDSVESLEARETKSGGKEFPVRVKITTRINHSSGEWVETTSFGDGQDRGDKGIYKAITGARKYGLASALNLATTDDAEDAGEGEGEAGELPQGRTQIAPRQTAADDI